MVLNLCSSVKLLLPPSSIFTKTLSFPAVTKLTKTKQKVGILLFWVKSIRLWRKVKPGQSGRHMEKNAHGEKHIWSMCHDWERSLSKQQVTCLRDATSNIFIPSLPFHMLAEQRRGFTLGHTSLITQRNITLQRINSNKPSSQSLTCTHSIMNHRPRKKHGLRRHGSAEAIYSTWGVICGGGGYRGCDSRPSRQQAREKENDDTGGWGGGKAICSEEYPGVR